ncbi:MAG TPA: C40 family peptidase [Puia sp.]|jgi:lipoprotein Spr
MKNRFILLLLIIQLTGCKVFQPASSGTDNLSASANTQGSTTKPNPSFIQDISTDPGNHSPSKSSQVIPVKTSGSGPGDPVSEKPMPHPVGTDDYNQLKFKYSILTNTPVEDLSNLRLLIFMDQWYGVPYHYGGTSRQGIDCSAFSSLLLSSVYSENQLPRMSADQYKATRRIAKKDLQEGDLVFFHTYGKGHRVTHVGVYLYNNRFIHASVAGVQISSMDEGYYLSHYIGAGRVNE